MKTKSNKLFNQKEFNEPLVKCCALSKKWFYQQYGFMLKGHYLTDCLSLDSVFICITGTNERFTKYKGSNETIQDAFAMDFMDMGIKSKTKCKDIFTLLKNAQEEAAKLEYYEIAHNITTVLTEFIKAIKKRHNEYHLWNLKHCT